MKDHAVHHQRHRHNPVEGGKSAIDHEEALERAERVVGLEVAAPHFGEGADGGGDGHVAHKTVGELAQIAEEQPADDDEEACG